MNDRAVSTVVDVTLCVLLVSAAVVTVAGVERAERPPAADAATETASILGSSTTRVSYSVAPVARGSSSPAFPRTDGPGFRRRAHGTYASMLADAAAANLSADGEDVAPLGDRFARAVADVTRPLLAGPGWRGQVVVAWRPYPGAHLGGRLVVGPSPPSSVDVYTARFSVSSGFPGARRSALAAAEAGYDAVAAVVAECVVRGLFPPGETHRALTGAYPDPRLTALRYGRFARHYGVSVAESVATDRPQRANAALAEAMTESIARDLRRRFDSPEAAARALEVDRVSLVVRTWSR